MQELTKEFEVSYAGETRFNIRRDGRPIGKVNVRRFGNSRMPYNEDYFERGILKRVGTVCWNSCEKWREFPPADVVALFPGFVGCRLVFHPRTPELSICDENYELPEVDYQYDGPAPELTPDPNVPSYITFVNE